MPNPFSKEFWKKWAEAERILLAAFLDSKLVGTVQVVLRTPPNQPHRADVAKLLVLRSARGQNVGTRLMEEAEQASRLAGRTLLVLDTATGGKARGCIRAWGGPGSG